MPHARSLTLLAAAAFLVTVSHAEPDAPRPLPASVTVLTRDDFANRHWFSVADVLDRAVSVNLSRTGYRGTTTTARLRGAGPSSAVVIAIDGRPLTHDFDGAVDLSQIPLNMIERIEITRGGANVSYGPATAGLINLITARPDRKGLTADLGTGVGRDGVRSSNGRVLSRSRAGDATYMGGLEDSGGFTVNDGSEFTSHFGNFTRSFKAGGFWGAEYLYTEGRAGKPDGTPLAFDQWNAHDENQVMNADGLEKREYQVMRLLGATPLIASGTVHVALTHAVRQYDEFGSGLHPVDRDNQTTEARVRYERLGLNIGGEFAALARKNAGLDRQKADRNAVFVTQRFDAGPLAFVPGFRWDDHSRAGEAPTLRGAVLYQPSPKWTGSLTAQRAPRFADMDEIFNAAGAAVSLDPEKSDSLDAGLVWQASRFRAGVTWFTSATRDVIATGTGGSLTNGAREQADGVEVEASGDIGPGGPWRELRLKGSWTTQTVKRRDIGASSYEAAPFAPRNLAWISADVPMPWKTSLTNEIRYEGEQFAGTGRTGARLPSYFIWNLRLNIRIHTADVYIAGENLTRQRYAEAFGTAGTLAPQPERTFWTGVTIRFLD